MLPTAPAAFMFKLITAICAVLGLGLMFQVQAATATDQFLQLKTGGPTAPVRTLLLSRDQKTLVSAGDDKTIQVWDTDSQKLTRTIRGEVAEDIQGAITTMALSPDERWLAVAVFYPHQENGQEVRGYLRIHDFASGKLERLVPGARQVMHTLRFSPDGSMLLGGESLPDGPRALIWDTGTWQLKQQFSGHKDGIRDASFAPDMRKIVTASWDGSMRVWDVATGKALIIKKNAHKGRLYSASIGHASAQPIVATGGTDKQVKIWNYDTGKLLRTIKFDRKIRQLVINPEGTRVLAASVGEHVNAWIAVIDVASGKVLRKYTDHNRFSLAMVLGADGDTVYSSGGFSNEIDRWSLSSGKRLARISGAGNPVQAVAIAADGTMVYWGHTPIDWSGKKYDFSKLASVSWQLNLKTRHGELGVPKTAGGEARKARRTQRKIGNVSLRRVKPTGKNFLSRLEIRRGGKTIGKIERDHKTGHVHSAFTLTPDGNKVITGGEVGYLSIHDLNGKKLGDFSGHNGDITDLAVSGDGKLLISGSRDQTFRVWNTDTTELLLSFFVGSNGEWIAWTSTGHYASSPDGDQYIGWVINQGAQRNAEYVQAEQMRNKLYRPDIVQKVLQARSLGAALQSSPQSNFSVAKVQEKQVIPVTFDVVSPQNGTATDQEAINLKVQLGQNAGTDVDWSVTVNGRQVLNPIKTRGLARTQPVGKSLTFPLVLDPGPNQIVVVADNNETRKTVELSVMRNSGQIADTTTSGSVSKSAAPLGANNSSREGSKLLVLAVGVDEYLTLPDHSLNYASADADSIANLFSKQVGRGYDKVETILLSDTQQKKASRDNIVDALDAMADLGPDDTVIVFLAGHGILEESDYYFLPRDAEKSASGRWKKSTVVAWSEIQRAMQSSLGRRILLVDTCHAESAFNSRLVKDAEDSNIIVMSSTDSETLAQEISSLGHGVFTYALVAGLDGEADSFKDGRITMSELNAFVANSVPSMTHNAQVPTLSVPGGFQDFVIASL